MAAPGSEELASRRTRLALFVLGLAGTLGGTLLPSSAVGWLRGHVPGFAWVWDTLNRFLPGFNPLHILLYAWLAFLWCSLWPRRAGWRMVAVLLAMGALTEWLQRLIPTRHARLSDVANDALGIVLGALLATWLADRKVDG